MCLQATWLARPLGAVRPRPLFEVGRVHTFRNSTRFCEAKQGSLPGREEPHGVPNQCVLRVRSIEAQQDVSVYQDGQLSVVVPIDALAAESRRGQVREVSAHLS